jgi:hypothetical protein
MASTRVLEKVGMRIYEESEHAISWCLEKQALSNHDGLSPNSPVGIIDNL